jgi:hypothetical protein
MPSAVLRWIFCSRIAFIMNNGHTQTPYRKSAMSSTRTHTMSSIKRRATRFPGAPQPNIAEMSRRYVSSSLRPCLTDGSASSTTATRVHAAHSSNASLLQSSAACEGLPGGASCARRTAAPCSRTSRRASKPWAWRIMSRRIWACCVRRARRIVFSSSQVCCASIKK